MKRNSFHFSKTFLISKTLLTDIQTSTFDVKEAIEELNMYLEGKKNICYVTSQTLQDFAQQHPYCASTIAYFAKDYQATEYDYPIIKKDDRTT